MKLLTKELEKRFVEIGDQQNDKDPVVIAKFLTRQGDRVGMQQNTIQKINAFLDMPHFGDYNDEWGYFSLDELESVRGMFGLGIERDLYCGEKPISEFNIPSLTK